MAKLKIYVQGNPVLNKKAKPVKKITKQHQRLIKDMIETMLAAPGVGLAAPQVGVLERVIVVKSDETVYSIINPKITKKKGKQVCFEGCLSVPGIEAPVERYQQICVQGLDKNGQSIKIDAQDFIAVIFQHEIDHLDGVLFVDKVSDLSQIKLTPKDTSDL